MKPGTSLPSIDLAGMSISRVGLGPWTVGPGQNGTARVATDDAAFNRIVLHALERGVNWLGTAAIEGFGHAEALLGALLKRLPEDERPFVFTKCGLIPDPRQAVASLRFWRTGRPERLRKEVDSSLKRLGVEQLDLCQMHWPAADTPLEEYWGTLVELRAAGKLRAAGLSNHSRPQLEAAEAVGHVDAVEVHFSASSRDSASAVIPWCRGAGTAVVAYSTMEHGLLSGGFTEQRALALPADDFRRRSPQFLPDALLANLAVARSMANVARRLDVPQPSVAVAWALAWPGVSAALVGAHHPDQLDDWLHAPDLRLQTQDLAEIDATTGSSAPTSPGVTP